MPVDKRCAGAGPPPAQIFFKTRPARSERYRAAITTNIQVGFPIRTSTDHGLFPAPRGLTQGITSFIASYCQGIHQTPFSRLI